MTRIDLSDPNMWAEHRPLGGPLMFALKAARHSGTPITEEYSTMVRALASIIDPLLYPGHAYGILTGSIEWGDLFARVRTVCDTAHCHSAAAAGLAALAREWPDIRTAALDARKR